jgi:hypothetical protein
MNYLYKNIKKLNIAAGQCITIRLIFFFIFPFYHLHTMYHTNIIMSKNISKKLLSSSFIFLEIIEFGSKFSHFHLLLLCVIINFLWLLKIVGGSRQGLMIIHFINWWEYQFWSHVSSFWPITWSLSF